MDGASFQYQIFDIQGRLISLPKIIHAHSIGIEISEYTKGILLFQVTDSQGLSKVFKVVNL